MHPTRRSDSSSCYLGKTKLSCLTMTTVFDTKRLSKSGTVSTESDINRFSISSNPSMWSSVRMIASHSVFCSLFFSGAANDAKHLTNRPHALYSPRKYLSSVLVLGGNIGCRSSNDFSVADNYVSFTISQIHSVYAYKKKHLFSLIVRPLF